MNQLSFTVPGPPRGKSRPRVLRSGITYTPKETVQAENLVKLCFQQAAPKDWLPREGPVSISIYVYHQPPKSWSQQKKKRLEAFEDGDTTIPCLKRPDCDNVLKLVCDALNQIAYVDDKQIYKVFIVRRWETPSRIEITLTFDEKPEAQ